MKSRSAMRTTSSGPDSSGNSAKNRLREDPAAFVLPAFDSIPATAGLSNAEAFHLEYSTCSRAPTRALGQRNRRSLTPGLSGSFFSPLENSGASCACAKMEAGARRFLLWSAGLIRLFIELLSRSLHRWFARVAQRDRQMRTIKNFRLVAEESPADIKPPMNANRRKFEVANFQTSLLSSHWRVHSR